MARLKDLPTEILMMIVKILTQKIEMEREEMQEMRQGLGSKYGPLYFDAAPPLLKTSRGILHAKKDLWSFVTTSRHLYNAFFPTVYQLDATLENPIALAWGAIIGCTTTMERAVATGANINAFTDTKVLDSFSRSRHRYRFGKGFNPFEDSLSRYRFERGLNLMEDIDVTDFFPPDQPGYLLVAATALHLAAANNQTRAVKWLLRHGADPHLGVGSVDVSGGMEHSWLPIGVAAWYGHIETIQTLLNCGTSLFACHKPKQGVSMNCLDIAATRGHRHLVHHLIETYDRAERTETSAEAHDMMKEHGKSAIHYAMRTPINGEMITYLASLGARCTFGTKYEEFGSASPDKPISLEIHPYSHGCFGNVLHVLAAGSHEPMTKADYLDIMSSYMTFPTPRSRTETGSGPYAKKWPPRINEEVTPGKTAIMIAAEGVPDQSVEFLGFFLDFPGCNINYQSSESGGDTALHVAIRTWLQHFSAMRHGPPFGAMSLEVSRIVLALLQHKFAKPDLLLPNKNGDTIFDLIKNHIRHVRAMLEDILRLLPASRASDRSEESFVKRGEASYDIGLYEVILETAQDRGLMTAGEHEVQAETLREIRRECASMG
ncbi:hypothetical protein OQA88_10753 [Cercophora sp. LCS_1]